MHNFTPEDLLEYHYGEMNEARAKELEQALKEDWTLREKLTVIREAGARLDKSIYSPGEAVVNRIMHYASSLTTVSAHN